MPTQLAPLIQQSKIRLDTIDSELLSKVQLPQ